MVGEMNFANNTKNKKFTILHFNDIHGNFLPEEGKD